MKQNSSINNQLSLCLLLLRLGIALVFVMWTVDKFINPEHAKAVFGKFYGISSLSEILTYSIGAVQSLLLLAFILGAFKSVSYLAVLVMHAVSTFSSYQQYLDPWTYPHLLFFAAFPMLAACFLLWKFRKFDRFLSLDAARNKSEVPELQIA